MARMSMANDAATPTTTSDVRSDRRAASIEATAANVTPPSSQRKSRPVEDDSRSPIETPSAARSDRSIPTAPMAATADPISRTGRRAGTFPPNARSPTTLAAKSIARPDVQAELARDARDRRSGRGRDGDARGDDRPGRDVDAEAERAGGEVTVGLGDDAPAHGVDAVGEVGGQRAPELVFLAGHGLDRTGLDVGAVDVQDVDDRELRVGRFGERHRDVGGGVIERRVGRRVRAREVGVGRGDAREPDRDRGGDREREHHARDAPHVPPPIVNVVCATTRGSNGP